MRVSTIVSGHCWASNASQRSRWLNFVRLCHPRQSHCKLVRANRGFSRNSVDHARMSWIRTALPGETDRKSPFGNRAKVDRSSPRLVGSFAVVEFADYIDRPSYPLIPYEDPHPFRVVPVSPAGDFSGRIACLIREPGQRDAFIHRFCVHSLSR